MAKKAWRVDYVDHGLFRPFYGAPSCNRRRAYPVETEIPR
jgi:hypothetical protein